MKEKELTMRERRNHGLLWMDQGENMQQQMRTRNLCMDYNETRPAEVEKRKQILQEIFGKCGEDVWIEPPLHAAMGKTVTIGEGTYINSNLTLVDDIEITIGRNVLIGPNVTISTTNHPLHYEMRPQGQMYSRKVVIEDHVWISSSVVISAGVTIGMGSVIGAGSVVTHDIPPMTVAYGVPCRVVRKITDQEKAQFESIPDSLL